MMISPETYYELYLKDKTADEILKAIRNLKRRITKLKRIMENPDYQCTMHPSESVQISCCREYLERAKQALVDMSVVYEPSKSELMVAEFNENIPYITNVTLSIGGYFYGIDEYKVALMDNDAMYSFGHSECGLPPEKVTIMDIDMTKEEFLEEFSRLHIGEWRKHYNTKRFGYTVCDGTHWSLEIKYSNGIKPVKIYGDNAYPYNFNSLKDLMGCANSEEDNEDE